MHADHQCRGRMLKLMNLGVPKTWQRGDPMGFMGRNRPKAEHFLISDGQFRLQFHA